jgi:long-chain acyl-CoA synthetase
MDSGELQGIMDQGRLLIDGHMTGYLDAEIDVDKTVAIVFTSGTTSFSKGVMLSQKNLVSTVLGATALVRHTDHDTMFSILPYHHVFESTIGILSSLNYGSTICINDSFKYMANNFKLFKPNAMFAVPAVVYGMYKRIKEAEAKWGRVLTAWKIKGAFGGNLKRIHCGSAPLKPEVIAAFNALGIELLPGYGLTEASPLVSTVRKGMLNSSNITSVGVSIPCCEVKILDGEIVIKGDNVFSGYYKAEELTKEAFTEDGWFKTGDLGRIDEDGLIYILGRKKNIIISPSGENVYPEEIEEAFIGSQVVQYILVYGGENSDTVTAVINPNNEILEGSSGIEITELVLKEVRSINKRFPLYKHIVEIKIRKTPLELTTSNKVKRSKANEMEGETYHV